MFGEGGEHCRGPEVDTGHYGSGGRVKGYDMDIVRSNVTTDMLFRQVLCH